MAYTNIDKPEDYFNAITWTGNASRPVSITGVGFQPDMVWAKSRSNAFNHVIYDSSRGAGQYKELTPNANWDEGGSNAHTYGYLTSFDSDGFSSTDSFDNHYFNNNGSTYVAWNWKANGGTTASNSDGDINSTVQVNSDAGFSIVKYTGNFTGSQGVGHGLSVRPDVVIIKNREQAQNWIVWTSSLASGNFLSLDTNNAASSSSRIYQNGYTTSTFGIGANNSVNKSGIDYVAYCFASKQGYSKFGKYVGNGNADGTFVYTGFKPAFVLATNTSNSGYDWRLVDSARNTFNLTDLLLMPNLSSAEFDGSTHAQNIGIDFLSNGFKCRSGQGAFNLNGGSYIYMAFAENPFVTSTGIPTTAR